MPVMDGIEATRLIAADERLSGVHVVILTNYGLDRAMTKLRARDRAQLVVFAYESGLVAPRRG